mmetsp:Transcript_30809/g.51821  ORF Transcript_30809/g.51821 Transcript_30809/m.51821 type:complete len:107 (-) Transcript_30809:21-341(-)
MVVVDEHGASIPAAYFMVSEESNTAIDEVLGYIKSFVPEWDPQVFIMDKSAAEMLAVRTRFPNAIIILRCDSMLRVLLDVFDRAIMQRHIRVNLKSTDPTKSLVHP